jgi:hypothetical protein
MGHTVDTPWTHIGHIPDMLHTFHTLGSKLSPVTAVSIVSSQLEQALCKT